MSDDTMLQALLAAIDEDPEQARQARIQASREARDWRDFRDPALSVPGRIDAERRRAKKQRKTR